MIFFVCGTGTGVGKTMVSAALAAGLADLGYQTAYWKPVQTGEERDADFVRRHSGAAILPEMFLFRAPLSPDQAARAEGAPQASIAALLKGGSGGERPWVPAAEHPTTRRYAATSRGVPPLHPPLQPLWCIEAAGGILVPLNDKPETWLDLLWQTHWPLILVAASGLGTLNHTALSLRALESRGLSPKAIVLSGPPHPENVQSLGRLFPAYAGRIHSFPHLEGASGHPDWRDASAALARFVTEAKETPYDPRPADFRTVWHPFTQHQTAPPPLAITRAQGVWLYDADGTPYFDATASWWVNTIGHGRPEIAAAISRQQQTLDHTLFAGTCHEPAAKLAAALIHRAPEMARCFFSDNGSTAVEVALKMALQYWHNQGKPRRRFLCLSGGYHGDTFGAMAAGNSTGFYQPFGDHLFPNLFLKPVTAHASALCPDGPDAHAKASAEMAQLFAHHHQDLAGVLVEPLIQGAGGMLVHHRPWLKELCQHAKDYNIPLIFDEVFTGMGRTGTFGAYQQLGIAPDILCLAKGLTGGTLPLAVTLTSETIFAAFLAEDTAKGLLHGHSFTGNAISCAAALATLQIYEDDRLLENCLRIQQDCQDWLKDTRLALVNARSLGAMMAFELPGTSYHNYFERHNSLQELARAHQLFLRPLGNTLYLVPPLSTSRDELRWALTQLEKLLQCLRS